MADYSRESSVEQSRNLSLNPSQEIPIHGKHVQSLIQPPAIASSMQHIPTYQPGKKGWASRLRYKNQQSSNALQIRHNQSQVQFSEQTKNQSVLTAASTAMRLQESSAEYQQTFLEKPNILPALPIAKSRLKNQSVHITMNSDLELKKGKSQKKKVQYHEQVEIIDPKPSQEREEQSKQGQAYNMQKLDFCDESYDSVFLPETSMKSTVPFSASKMRSTSIFELESQDRQSLNSWAPMWGGDEIKPLRDYMGFYGDSYQQFSKKDYTKLKKSRATMHLNVMDLQERGERGRQRQAKFLKGRDKWKLVDVASAYESQLAYAQNSMMFETMGNSKAQSETRLLPRINTAGKDGFAEEYDSIFSNAPSTQLVDVQQQHRTFATRHSSVPDARPYQVDSLERLHQTQDIKTLESKQNDDSFSMPREANSSFDSLLNLEVDENEILEVKEVPVEMKKQNTKLKGLSLKELREKQRLEKLQKYNYKRQAKIDFMRRLNVNVEASIAAEGRTRKGKLLRNIQEKHTYQFFGYKFQNLRFVRPEYDQDRLEVLGWMEKNLKDVLFLITERKLFAAVDYVFYLILISKTFIDRNMTFLFLKLLGTLLMHLGMYTKAIDLFLVMRDLGYQNLNWSFLIQSFDLLGRSLKKSAQYKESIIAYKKLLYVAWSTDSPEYEFKAYLGIGKQHYYEQNIKKCKMYVAKALCGEVEPEDSQQRKTSIEQLRKLLIDSKEKIDKYQRFGFHVDYSGFDRMVNCTYSYEQAKELVKEFYALDKKSTVLQNIETRIGEIATHKFGGRIIPQFPPCHIKQESEVQSPSGVNMHEVLLPEPPKEKNQTQALIKKKRGRQQPSDGAIAEESSSDEDTSFIRSGKARKLFQVPKERPDYLRPQWEEREWRERLRGHYEIDWNDIVERAKILSHIKNKAFSYFTHQVGHGEVRDSQLDKSKYKQMLKSMKKDKGVSKTELEIQYFINSRVTQQNYKATEAVVRELIGVGYNCYHYLTSMQKCSYICRGEFRGSKHGGKVDMTFYCDDKMRKIYDLTY